jgi:hypothetical protein
MRNALGPDAPAERSGAGASAPNITPLQLIQLIPICRDVRRFGNILNRSPNRRTCDCQPLTDDCHCAEDIEDLRKGDGGAWSPQPDFHPYYATGDFDGDGFDDAAIVVAPRDTGAKVSVVIFFGSPAGLMNDVSVVPRDGSSVADRGLFLARPDQRAARRRARLLFGAFGSEAEPVPVKHKSATTSKAH